MSEVVDRVRRFFFPPQGAPRWRRLLPYGTMGMFTLVALLGFAFMWEYTNSPAFCGTTCHTMPPEYTSYLTSPHARVACVDCHIGEGFITTRITRKAGDAKHIIRLAFSTYEFPIRVHEMRPARETCERCHFPEKFSDDSLRQIKRFGNDINNTPSTTYLTLKTGGGSKRLGLGRGIHWHIENSVQFYALDELEQVIPYVRVIQDDGTVVEYTDVNMDIDPDEIPPEEMHEMDCITCHNRITHLIMPPDDLVDELLAREEISISIPEIRLKAIQVLQGPYETTEIAMRAIEGLEGYYKAYYPEFYEEEGDELQNAIEVLKQSYVNSVFPEQKQDWNTHANNIGHKDSPGCFRCHGGQHLNEQGEAIRLECNICHSIPVVAGPTDLVAEIELSRGPEPESHLNPNWIALHHEAFNETCSSCHTMENPGGSDNTSFCSNSACHGVEWPQADLNAPALREALSDQLPEVAPPPVPTPMPAPEEGELTWDDAIGPLFASRCGACHGENGIEGLNLTTYETALSGGNGGPGIAPGDPDSSLVVIKQGGATPHPGQLTTEELKVVIQWIEAGAPES